MAFSAAVRKHPKPLVLSYSPGGGNTVEAGRWVAGQATAPTPGGEGVTGPSTQPLGTMYRIVTDFHGGWCKSVRLCRISLKSNPVRFLRQTAGAGCSRAS